MKKINKFNYEIIIYPLFVTLTIWIIYWGEFVAPFELNHFGILPRTASGLVGIIFSPLLHSTNDINHIVNNTIPIFFLLMALFYFYKESAIKVFALSWILTGTLTWIIAKNEGSYHIGISGIIYALVFFLFISGILKKQNQYQAISLLIVLLYGSLLWGIFPMEEKVSWQGHLAGTISGIFLAFYYFEKPKKNIQIKKEDLEWNDSNYIENIKLEYKFNTTLSNDKYDTNYNYITKSEENIDS